MNADTWSNVAYGCSTSCVLEQISLRPAQSFLLAPKPQPQIPAMIPHSAPPPRTQTPPLGQVSNPPPACLALPPPPTPPQLPASEGPSSSIPCSILPPQLGLKTNPPPIQEKPQKINKKPPPSKEELLKMTVRCLLLHFLLTVKEGSDRGRGFTTGPPPPQPPTIVAGEKGLLLVLRVPSLTA